ncbi:MAG: hypothetical protein K2L89_04580, partial [Muribaculaceae bacterium]|nr:hypothetical protein [Muribaculaceae bacterium]
VPSTSLESCYLNNELIYSYGEFKKTSEVKELSDAPNNISKTYDLYGREVKTILPGSVYIRNGKKFVGR